MYMIILLTFRLEFIHLGTFAEERENVVPVQPKVTTVVSIDEATWRNEIYKR